MMKKHLMTSLTFAGILFTALVFTKPAHSGEETEVPSADMTTGIYSAYVWRGNELSKDSLVIQPSVTVGYKGLSFNLWGNLDTDQSLDIFDEDGSNWNETDMTLSFEGSHGMFGYSAGYIYYALEGADSQEIYASIGLDLFASPTLTIYRDIAEFPGWYITLDISHSVKLSNNLALNLGAKASYMVVDDEDTLADPNDATSAYSALHDGTLSIGLSYSPMEHITISPEIYYSFALSSDAEDVLEAASADGNDSSFFYGGVGVSLSF